MYNYPFTYQTTKFLDQSKLKAFADDKITMVQKLKFACVG